MRRSGNKSGRLQLAKNKIATAHRPIDVYLEDLFFAPNVSFLPPF